MLWDKFRRVEDKQRFQKILFPDGLAYSASSGFGTAVNSPIVNVIEQETAEDSGLARPRGVEPRLPG